MNSDTSLRLRAVRSRLLAPGLCLCLLVLTFVFARFAHAEVALDARIGFGQSAAGASHYRPGTWTPITIYLTGQGARGIGQLTVTVHQGGRTTAYTRKISLREGQLNEAVNFVFEFLPVTANGMMNGSVTPDISAQLVLDGRELAKRRFALPLPVNAETYNILALTRDGSGMNFLSKKKLGLLHRGANPGSLINRYGGSVPNNPGYNVLEKLASAQLLYCDPRALPGLSQGYAMIDAVTLADLPLDNLTEDQISALQSYVREGGLLVLSGGGDLSRLKSQFYQEMLPIQASAAATVNDKAPELTALQERYKEPLGFRDSVALTVGTLKPGASILFGPAKGVTGYGLVAARPYGAGTVVFTAFDFLAPEFRGWKQSPSLWRDLLRCNNQSISPRASLAGQAHFGQQTGIKTLSDALAGKQASSSPPFAIVAWFLGMYIFLLIPASYWLLKKLDKRELAWFTAPALILGFTVVSYLIALTIKGAALTLNRVIVLETQANTDQVAGYGEMTIYSPRRANYDIALAPPGDLGRPYHTVVPGEVFEANEVASSDLTIEHDQTTKMINTQVNLWDKRSFDTPIITSLGGPVEIKTEMENGDRVQVTVTNKTRFTINDCALVNDKGQTISLGTLAPGETRQPKEPLSWAYKESSLSLHLPPAPATWQYSNSINNQQAETPEQIRNNMRYALTQALSQTTNPNQQYYNGMMNDEEDAQVFGRVTNAFVGWVDTAAHPVLNVQIDGKAAVGEEAALLYVHLPTPKNASKQIARASNPFEQDAILNLKDDQPGYLGRGPVQ